MNTSPAAEPAMEEIYDANAEYYDTITRGRVAELQRIVADFATRVDRGGAPVLDIGAGTGRLTAHLAGLIAPCEVIAIEPTRSLRAILASRIADNDQLVPQVTIIPHTLAAAATMLPAQIGGAMVFGVLPHLGTAARRQLLEFFADRLMPGRSALVEVMPPWTTDPIAMSPVADARTGRHRIECFMQAQPVGTDQLNWTMTYRRIDEHGLVVHEATADSLCWVTAPHTFESEARQCGLQVEWPAPEIAQLMRATTS